MSIKLLGGVCHVVCSCVSSFLVTGRAYASGLCVFVQVGGQFKQSIETGVIVPCAMLTLLDIQCPDYRSCDRLRSDEDGQGFGPVWRPERFLDDASLYPKLQEHTVGTIRQCYSFIEYKFASSKS